MSDQVAAGLITPEQARFSPHRNVITRALGYQPEVTVDIFRLPLAAQRYDCAFVGWIARSDKRQRNYPIVTTQPPEQATQALIELANSRGGTDNITVVLAQVDALEWYGATPALGSDAPDDEPEELHERTTVELPVTGQFAADAAPEVPIAPDSSATPPAAPAPPMPPEPRLNWRGLALALGLLVVLIAIILFAAPTLLAPGTSPTSPPATTTTAVTTPAPTTPGSTAAPGAAPTVAPAPGTALPTGATSKSSY